MSEQSIRGSVLLVDLGLDDGLYLGCSLLFDTFALLLDDEFIFGKKFFHANEFLSECPGAKGWHLRYKARSSLDLLRGNRATDLSLIDASNSHWRRPLAGELLPLHPETRPYGHFRSFFAAFPFRTFGSTLLLLLIGLYLSWVTSAAVFRFDRLVLTTLMTKRPGLYFFELTICGLRADWLYKFGWQ